MTMNLPESTQVKRFYSRYKNLKHRVLICDIKEGGVTIQLKIKHHPNASLFHYLQVMSVVEWQTNHGYVQKLIEMVLEKEEEYGERDSITTVIDVVAELYPKFWELPELINWGEEVSKLFQDIVAFTDQHYPVNSNDRAASLSRIQPDQMMEIMEMVESLQKYKNS